MNRKIYEAWRESEAHAVPMTIEGETLAGERMRGFSKGYIAGLREAANLLEHIHSHHKHAHKFYYFSSQLVRASYKDLEQP